MIAGVVVRGPAIEAAVISSASLGWYRSKTKAGKPTRVVHAFEAYGVVSLCGRVKGRAGRRVSRGWLEIVRSTPPPILNGSLVHRPKPCAACWKASA